MGDEIIDLAVAVVASALAAAFIGLVGIFVGMTMGGALYWLGLLTDEGAAWSGVSLGIPTGTILAVLGFIYTFRKVRHYGESE